MTIGVFPVLSYGQDDINFTIGKTPYRISLSTGTGVLLGQSEEIVYKYSKKDDKLSQLNWDLNPLVYLGSALSFSRADPLAGLGVAADLSVKFGLPILSGTMEDRDWHDSSVSTSYDDPRLTNFSSHDAYIQGAMLLDVSGGISIPIAAEVVIKAMLSVSYMRFSWIAQDGYLEYMQDGWDKKYLQGTGITYDQNWLILSPELGLFWPFHQVLTLDFRFFISPLIFASNTDTHINKNVQYSDIIQGGLYLEPYLDLSFSSNQNLSLVLHGSWRYITGTRGDTYLLMIGSSSNLFQKNPDGIRAGASYSAFDLGLSLKFALPLGKLSKKN
ncbi:omptin family outer membrane protease [Treponema primitia]|uniref:omptin family outer membrane protease n=1 Tax=Treponema primitia TaxID=88058 RepID=UPI001E5D8871|nr:omptin family outer membrane protease [Treponema primitia]